MRELQREEIGNRRVRLLACQAGRYIVTIEGRGPQRAWEDISLTLIAISSCTRPACAIGSA